MMVPSPLSDPTLHERFRVAAHAAGMDPEDRWVGGYVDYEWRHLRPLLDTYGLGLAGARVLELGCNVGGSTVVMAAMGARVTGIDVNEGAVGVARANIALHGLESAGDALHMSDSAALPFADDAFDLALANSVLEYVDPSALPAILAELARVLRPGGRLLVCGTASRLAPHSVHEGRWLVNYLPRWTDRLAGGPRARGLSPLALNRALAGRFEVTGGDRWIEARRAVHGRASTGARVVARIARTAGIAPGWISPHIELLLRRR